MPQRIQADATRRISSHVTEVFCHIAVCRFVQRNRE